MIPENFETGEYKIGGTAEIDDLEQWYVIAYTTSDDEIGHFGFNYNGIYSGIEYLVYSSYTELRSVIMNLHESGKTNHILTIFTLPKLAFYPLNNIGNALDKDFIATPKIVNLVSTPNNLDGYIPINQKLRTYPYMYIGFNPNRWYRFNLSL